jgi:hypothetical protein
MVAVARIIPIVNVAIKAVTAMKPWAGSDEEAAKEPIRTIVAIRRTAIRGIVEITVRAHRSYPDTNTHLSLSFGSGSC